MIPQKDTETIPEHVCPSKNYWIHLAWRMFDIETCRNEKADTSLSNISQSSREQMNYLDRNSKINKSIDIMTIRKSADTKLRRSKSLQETDKPSIQNNISVKQKTENFYLGKASCSCSCGVTVCERSPDSNCSNVRITEVAPSGRSIVDAEDNTKWKVPIDKFTSKKKERNLKDTDERKLPKRIRSYYKAQDELITSYEELQVDVEVVMEKTDTLSKKPQVTFYAKLSSLCIAILLIAKVVATVLSGSMSVISSLVDSFVDLTSGIIIWWSTRAMEKCDLYVYPKGRTNLEPVAIIILSVIMSLASVLLIEESVSLIISFAMDHDKTPPSFDTPTLVITCSVVVIRFVLFILCRRVKSSSMRALAQDHRNDVMLNTVVIICGYVGSQQMRERTMIYGLAFLDPIGAILISLYIVIDWWMTGYEQLKMLTGHTAKPEFLNKITWLCINHHKELRYLDTVRAFHFGNKLLVEVDIVLPADMSLIQAQDIGEGLQKKLERFPDVERAFVHSTCGRDSKSEDQPAPL